MFWKKCQVEYSFEHSWASAKLYVVLFLVSLYPLSYTAPSELCCTPLSCACILLSYNTPYWATLHPVELWCRGLGHPLPTYWAMLYPSEIHCTFWAMLHLTEPRGTLLSYTAPPYLLAHPNWTTLQHTELRWTLLSHAEPYWATLYPTELRCSLRSYAAPCELHYSLTELPTVLVPLCNFVKCRNAELSGTGISVPQYGAGMLRYGTDIIGLLSHYEVRGKFFFIKNFMFHPTFYREHLIFITGHSFNPPWLSIPFTTGLLLFCSRRTAGQFFRMAGPLLYCVTEQITINQSSQRWCREFWILRGPQAPHSSSFWVSRNRSNHMEKQARTGESVLVKSREMTKFCCGGWREKR